jgi:hypothetical protein
VYVRNTHGFPARCGASGVIINGTDIAFESFD